MKELSTGVAAAPEELRHRRQWHGPFLFVVTWAVVLIYAMTAHLTNGQRADFGREWMAGRLIVSGQGRFLYEPDHQQAVLGPQLDDESLARLYIPGVGWLTYPPVQGLVYAPLGALPPKAAQWCVVELSLAAVVLAGLALSRSTAGTVSAPAIVLAVLLQPAFFCNVGLGQNAALTLILIFGGWCLGKQGQWLTAGLVWGCLAYKPTWGVAVVWIPLALGQPRAYLGMFLSAATLALLTLPFCGIDAWFSWWEVARRVETGYADVVKWEWMRRDLTGLIRQTLGDIHPLWGWIGLILVVMVTAIVWRRSAGTSLRLTRDALVLSAVVLTCPRFMFYDIVMAAPAMVVALSEWTGLSKWSRVILLALVLAYFAAFPLGYGAWPLFWAVETASILGLWLWCVWQLVPSCRNAG